MDVNENWISSCNYIFIFIEIYFKHILNWWERAWTHKILFLPLKILKLKWLIYVVAKVTCEHWKTILKGHYSHSMVLQVQVNLLQKLLHSFSFFYRISYTKNVYEWVVNPLICKSLWLLFHNENIIVNKTFYKYW